MVRSASVKLSPAGLSPVEADFIEIFVAAADLLGAPRSWGEIYGLVYASAKPVSFQDIVDRLGISKGSASQGLRMLQSLGAVCTVYVPGDRRNHFTPELELRALIGGLIRDRIGPHIEQGPRRLAQVRQDVKDAKNLTRAESQILNQRVRKLASWQRKSATFLPLIERFVL